MFGRSVKRFVVDTRWPLLSALPPNVLLSIRSRSFNSTTPIVEDVLIPEALKGPSTIHAHSKPTGKAPLGAPEGFRSYLLTRSPSAKQLSSHAPVDESIIKLLPLLKAQGSHYVTAHIHARPYLLTLGDTLRLPFHMPDVVPGDVLRLTRASNIGSRDYTLRGTPYIDEQLFECRARVIGVEAEPMRIKEKTKRRQRHVKTVRSKHRFTVLKISELKINSLDETGA